jgi:hypothetical protein
MNCVVAFFACDVLWAYCFLPLLALVFCAMGVADGSGSFLLFLLKGSKGRGGGYW